MLVKVLYASDLSVAGERARTIIANLPWPNGSTLKVVLVEQPTPQVEGVDNQLSLKVTQGTVARAEEHLALRASSLAHPNLLVTYEVLIGNVVDQILAQAEMLRPDLLIIGSRGRGALQSTLFGSVAFSVTEAASCPVLVPRTDRLAKVLVVDDGTANGEAAVKAVAELPILRGAEIIVLGLVQSTAMPWESYSVPLAEAFLTPDELQKYAYAAGAARRAAEERVRQAADTLGAGGLAAVSAVGDNTSGEIVKYAAEADVDLIIIASGRRPGVIASLLHNVTRSVLVHAPCSVLVVHPSPSS